MNDINIFFENLSWRIKNENGLSDITWAFCESSEEFRNIFLTFFFGEDDYKWNKGVNFQREYSRAGSRPDFYFENNDIEYIIEVKINDRNQHFEQYNKPDTFASVRKGYITNYEIANHTEYSLKTWENFITYLETIDNDINLLEDYTSKPYKEDGAYYFELSEKRLK